MQQDQKTRRLYNISDSNMIQDSQVSLALFRINQDAFTAFDPTLNDEFAAEWDVAISAALAFQTDENYRDQLTGKTAAVAEVKAACRDKYADMKYFVQKGWPNNVAVQNEFGFNDYDSARLSDSKLVVFMETMHTVASKNEYKAVLVSPAVGCNQLMIDEIETLATLLNTKNVEQEVFAKEQLTVTQNRVATNNNVWRFRTLVAAAAKRVFRNDYARNHQFLLNASDAPESDFSIKGTILAQAGGTPIEGARVYIEALDLEAFSNEFGKFGIVDNIPPGTYVLAVSAVGFADQSLSTTVTSEDETVVVNVALING